MLRSLLTVFGAFLLCVFSLLQQNLTSGVTLFSIGCFLLVVPVCLNYTERRPKSTKTRPANPADAELRISHVRDMIRDKEQLALFLGKFNHYGFVVVTPDEISDNLLALGEIFGSKVPHEKMDATGLVIIDSANPTSINVAQTEMEHMPHTDESYAERPSLIMTLQCIQPSVSGGISMLLSAQEMYDAVVRNSNCDSEVTSLMDSDCITVGRTLPGLAQHKEYQFPIFAQDSETSRRVMRWRSRDTYVQKVSSGAVRSYDCLNDFVNDDANRFYHKLTPGQIFVVDNTAWAHGRTPFPAGERRILHRINYFNDGALASRVQIGF